MKKKYNPYANALDGLILNDPVNAFFEFCKERENIRKKREQGIPPPWSDDPIFQKGRFLNVFREDDRGTKAIIKFSKDQKTKLPDLVHCLFFARWCNRQETLDKISPKILSNSKKIIKILNEINSWCNLTAYPVESVFWKKKQYSRFETATILFANIKEPLTEVIINSKGNVIKATNSINNLFKMQNNFPIFMAIIDLAWFRPDIINPKSPVPTGIGAVAYLNRLQKHFGLNNHQDTCEKMIELQKVYWPEAKRIFQPIDIEYLACECRKYYSYANGTKQFKGKNRFYPKIN